MACRIFGAQAHVVMPQDAPAIKRAATEGYGAHVIPYDPRVAVREELAATLATEHGYTVIPPYDHIDIVAGQSAAALELCEDVGELDVLLVPCGGGAC